MLTGYCTAIAMVMPLQYQVVLNHVIGHNYTMGLKFECPCVRSACHLQASFFFLFPARFAVLYTLSNVLMISR